MDLYGKPIGGGISFDTLPKQITNLTATAGTDGTVGFIDVSFSEVPSTSWNLLKSYIIVYKTDSVPISPFDGTRIIVSKVSASTTRTQRISGLTFDQLYGIRIFPLSLKNRYQTSIIDATATATPLNGIRLDSLLASTTVDRIKLLENGSNQQFLVLKHNYENSGRTLITRKDIYTTRLWNTTAVNTYASSSIDSYLNGTYYNLLGENIKSKIISVNIPYTIGGGNNTITTLSRKIFLCSFTELGRSSSSANIEGTTILYFNSDSRRISYLNGVATSYWSRTPNISIVEYAFGIDSVGSQDSSRVAVINSGVRPAFTLPADMLFNPTPDTDGCYIPL